MPLKMELSLSSNFDSERQPIGLSPHMDLERLPKACEGTYNSFRLLPVGDRSIRKAICKRTRSKVSSAPSSRYSHPSSISTVRQLVIDDDPPPKTENLPVINEEPQSTTSGMLRIRHCTVVLQRIPDDINTSDVQLNQSQCQTPVLKLYSSLGSQISDVPSFPVNGTQEIIDDKPASSDHSSHCSPSAHHSMKSIVGQTDSSSKVPQRSSSNSQERNVIKVAQPNSVHSTSSLTQMLAPQAKSVQLTVKKAISPVQSPIDLPSDSAMQCNAPAILPLPSDPGKLPLSTSRVGPRVNFLFPLPHVLLCPEESCRQIFNVEAWPHVQYFLDEHYWQVHKLKITEWLSWCSLCSTRITSPVIQHPCFCDWPLPIEGAENAILRRCPVKSCRLSDYLHVVFPVNSTFQCTEDGCKMSFNLTKQWPHGFIEQVTVHLQLFHSIHIKKSTHWCSYCGTVIEDLFSMHSCFRRAPSLIQRTDLCPIDALANRSAIRCPSLKTRLLPTTEQTTQQQQVSEQQIANRVSFPNTESTPISLLANSRTTLDKPQSCKLPAKNLRLGKFLHIRLPHASNFFRCIEDNCRHTIKIDPKWPLKAVEKMRKHLRRHHKLVIVHTNYWCTICSDIIVSYFKDHACFVMNNTSEVTRDTPLAQPPPSTTGKRVNFISPLLQGNVPSSQGLPPADEPPS